MEILRRRALIVQEVIPSEEVSLEPRTVSRQYVDVQWTCILSLSFFYCCLLRSIYPQALVVVMIILRRTAPPCHTELCPFFSQLS